MGHHQASLSRLTPSVPYLNVLTPRSIWTPSSLSSSDHLQSFTLSLFSTPSSWAHCCIQSLFLLCRKLLSFSKFCLLLNRLVDSHRIPFQSILTTCAQRPIVHPSQRDLSFSFTMAPLSKTLAFAAIFAAFTSAAPMNKRGVVYETVTDVVWTTVDTTITLHPGEPTPTATEVITKATAVAVTSAKSTTTAAPAPPAPAAPAPARHESSSSSTEAAPQPTTTSAPEVTSAPAPEPTTSSSSSSTTSSAPAPSSSSSSGGSSNGQCSESSPCSGRGTYYDTATTTSNPSYCDTTNDGLTENVVALSSAIMDQSLCGKTITVSYGGKTSTAKVVEKCPSCSAGSIDMSRALFGDLANLDLGVITVDWHFN
jgi:hypothetical protein